MINESSFKPIGAHNDGLNISTAQTLAQPDGATMLCIQALSQNARFTLDGTTPTATLGFQLKVGAQPVVIPIHNGTVFKIIQEAATCDLQFQWGGFW